jgi:MFS family permease
MGAGFLALFAFPFFWLLDTGSVPLIWLAIILVNVVGVYGMFAPQGALLAELFDTRVRYSGIAVSREVSAPFAGGIAPFVATALLAWSGGEPWPIALYAIVLALITFVSVYLTPETYHERAAEDDREVAIQRELA